MNKDYSNGLKPSNVYNVLKNRTKNHDLITIYTKGVGIIYPHKSVDNYSIRKSNFPFNKIPTVITDLLGLHKTKEVMYVSRIDYPPKYENSATVVLYDEEYKSLAKQIVTGFKNMGISTALSEQYKPNSN